MGSFEPHSYPSGRPSRKDLKKFWNGWWDRKLETSRGKDGWDAQLEFLEGVIKRLKDKNSTLGFEILMNHRYSDRSILER
jgi:chemotaxis regulatin CheY-phosphate phosphatase CheZ